MFSKCFFSLQFSIKIADVLDRPFLSIQYHYDKKEKEETSGPQEAQVDHQKYL